MAESGKREMGEAESGDWEGGGQMRDGCALASRCSAHVSLRASRPTGELDAESLDVRAHVGRGVEEVLKDD